MSDFKPFTPLERTLAEALRCRCKLEPLQAIAKVMNDLLNELNLYYHVEKVRREEIMSFVGKQLPMRSL